MTTTTSMTFQVPSLFLQTHHWRVFEVTSQREPADLLGARWDAAECEARNSLPGRCRDDDQQRQQQQQQQQQEEKTKKKKKKNRKMKMKLLVDLRFGPYFWWLKPQKITPTTFHPSSPTIWAPATHHCPACISYFKTFPSAFTSTVVSKAAASLKVKRPSTLP